MCAGAGCSRLPAPACNGHCNGNTGTLGQYRQVHDKLMSVRSNRFTGPTHDRVPDTAAEDAAADCNRLVQRVQVS